mmetsp:Transcript_21505/g.65707  ORF Transcript_21505/g.65707 Transcript_21505/m.65707 type:complete len:333 (-) Transcript_21505:1008-2006(-)
MHPRSAPTTPRNGERVSDPFPDASAEGWVIPSATMLRRSSSEGTTLATPPLELEEADAAGIYDEGMSDEELRALVERTNMLAMAVVEQHLDEFLRDRPSGRYEGWIAELHPENAYLDARFYLADQPHLLLWNERVGASDASRRVAPRVPEDPAQPSPEVPESDAAPTVASSRPRSITAYGCPPIVAAFMAASVSEAAALTICRQVMGRFAHAWCKAARVASREAEAAGTWRSPKALVCGFTAGTAYILAGSFWAADGGMAVAERATKHGIATAGACAAAVFTLNPESAAKTYRTLAGLHDRTRAIFPKAPPHPLAAPLSRRFRRSRAEAQIM